MFTGIGIAAVLALGVGIWAFMFAFKPSSKTETVPGTTAQQKQPDANAAKTQDGPATTAAVKPAGPVLPAVTPPTTPVVSQPDTATPAVQPPEQAQPTVQPQPVLQPPPPKEPVVWPVLIVNGVVGRGKQGSVKINNEILGVGDTVGDVRIMSIEVQGVLLGYKGETKLLRVGGSTQ
jgi:outer membrane biosynthesis protein TonB